MTEKTKTIEYLENHEDRITNLEEVALILRAKIEPETLTPEAIDRANALMDERGKTLRQTRRCVRSC